jgi:hypothetical protein
MQGEQRHANEAYEASDLLTAAVISATVLCAAGIATLSGLLPSSLGASRIAEPLFKAI